MPAASGLHGFDFSLANRCASVVLHRFHDISEDLTVLVFFAPAEYSQRGS